MSIDIVMKVATPVLQTIHTNFEDEHQVRSPRTPIYMPDSPLTCLSPFDPTKSFITTPTSPTNYIALPPPPETPLAWVWQCHLCRQRYPLAVTRRCLLDGHYYCSGGNDQRNLKRKKKGQSCSSEFDYVGWKAYAEWRQKVFQATVESRGLKGCEKCNYPSECRYPPSTSQVVQKATVKIDGEKKSDTNRASGKKTFQDKPPLNTTVSASGKKKKSTKKGSLPPIQEELAKAGNGLSLEEFNAMTTKGACEDLFHKIHETVDLRVGGNGHVKLDISRPKVLDYDKPSNILVYLPPGPLPSGIQSNHNDETITKSLLTDLPSTTLVKINYRLSHPPDGKEGFRFPTPIHDISVAFDYLTSSTSSFNSSRNHAPKICLTGTHIGGALATTLALTEPNKIHAIAVTNPLADWVILDEILAKAKAAIAQTDKISTPGTSLISSRRKSVSKDPSPLSQPNSTPPETIAKAARTLINLRSLLFANPSSYFDPFASPTLFLRAPGRDTPLARTAAMVTQNDTELDADLSSLTLDEEDTSEPYPTSPRNPGEQEIENEAYGPYDDDYSSVPRSSNPTPSIPPTSPSSRVTGPRRRKVLRRWPPVSLPESTVLPYTLVTIPLSDNGNGVNEGLNAIYRSQGTELAELLRRACFWGREKGVGEERVVLRELGRVESQRRSGNEDSANQVDTGAEGIAGWIRQRFEE